MESYCMASLHNRNSLNCDPVPRVNASTCGHIPRTRQFSKRAVKTKMSMYTCVHCFQLFAFRETCLRCHRWQPAAAACVLLHMKGSKLADGRDIFNASLGMGCVQLRQAAADEGSARGGSRALRMTVDKRRSGCASAYVRGIWIQNGRIMHASC